MLEPKRKRRINDDGPTKRIKEGRKVKKKIQEVRGREKDEENRHKRERERERERRLSLCPNSSSFDK